LNPEIPFQIRTHLVTQWHLQWFQNHERKEGMNLTNNMKQFKVEDGVFAVST
jgi:hypothetical protein